METRTRRFPLILTTLIAFAAVPGFAAKEIVPTDKSNLGLTGSESTLPAGTLTSEGKFSDGLQSGSVDALVPFASTHGLTFFSNVRGTWDDHSQALFSVGLGARYLVPGHDIILGANVYYDHVDGQLGNDFHQLGIGAEVLTKWFDARFNYYLPESDLKLSSVGPGLVRLESGIEGWNAEAGFLLPWIERYLEMRVFGGRYDYRSNFGSHSSGWKARTEIRWTPGIITGLEWWDDKTLNGGNWIANVRVTLPFEIGNIFRGRNPFVGAAEAFRFGAKREFKQRLGDTVERSHRVQTAQSGTLVDIRYLRVLTVTTTSASGQQVSQRYLVYTPTPSGNASGATVLVGSNGAVTSFSNGSISTGITNTGGGISAGALTISSNNGNQANRNIANTAPITPGTGGITVTGSGGALTTTTLDTISVGSGGNLVAGGALTQSGAGTLVLVGGANTYTGNTTVTSGALIANTGILGFGGTTGPLTINTLGNLTFSQPYTGTINAQNGTILNNSGASITLGNGTIIPVGGSATVINGVTTSTSP